MIMLINWNIVNNTHAMIESYYRFTFMYFSSLSTSTHKASLLEVFAKNNLRSSACGLLFILHTLSEEINSKCTIDDHKNSLGKSIWRYTKYHMEYVGTDYNFEPFRKWELSKSLYINRVPSNEEAIKGFAMAFNCHILAYLTLASVKMLLSSTLLI